MKRAFSFQIVFFLGCLLLFNQVAFAASASEIRNRMKQRQPAINALKSQKIVGEDNKGYLSFRAGKKNASTVAAENKDRKTIYTLIAKKQNSTALHVGQRRALQLAKQGKKGHLFQNAQGKWYTK